MNAKQFHNFIKTKYPNLGLLELNNLIITRQEIAEYLHEGGYAARTIQNDLSLSRDGGIINRLISAGVIQSAGLRRWRIVDAKKLELMANEKRRPVVRSFYGNEPDMSDGWAPCARLDDGEVDGVEWLLFRKIKSANYINLKVAALGGPVEHKANFWMEVRNGKLAMTSDAMLLRAHHKSIFDAVAEEVAEMVGGE